MVNQINADSGIRRRSQTFRDLVLILLRTVGIMARLLARLVPLRTAGTKSRFSARVVHGKLSVPGGQVGDPGTWTFSGGLRCAPRGAE